MQRIKFGAETTRRILNATCPGCGVKQGEHHRDGCAVEICPICHRQVLYCGCNQKSEKNGGERCKE